MRLENYFILCYESPKKNTLRTNYLVDQKSVSLKSNIKNLLDLYWLNNLYVITEEPDELANELPFNFSNSNIFITQPTIGRIRSIAQMIGTKNPQACVTICYLNNMMLDFAHFKESLQVAENIARYYPVLLAVGAENEEVDLTYGYIRYNQTTNHTAKQALSYYVNSSLNALTVKYDTDVICYSGVLSANILTLNRNLETLEKQLNEDLNILPIHTLLKHANNLYTLPAKCNWYTVSTSNRNNIRTSQLKVA